METNLLARSRCLPTTDESHITLEGLHSTIELSNTTRKSISLDLDLPGSLSFQSIRRTATILQPNSVLTSTSNDPRRTIACNDITLPSNPNQNNSFFRRRTQQQPTSAGFNGQSEKSSSIHDEHVSKSTSNTFSLLRHHSSPTNPHHKIDKSAYDNLTDATLPADATLTTSTHLERKSSYPLNRKSNRHATNDSLASDAYDNYPDKNGYDNYPIRKPSMMTTSQNDVDGN